ncbi:MAG: glycerol-3-phosphate dehydrogenase/oxidase [Sphingobacteriales bacterium JAD_PAG50586_3]|nr:MAG: glycerol-3-phosphate dehydrogenase/oxidase [Sphingobacteriales bacterium JAD_PAG50586_3]
MNNQENLSSLNRAAISKQLSDKEYDILVIGGGITGAGIALDAATRGLTVALIEKQDFAAGTSSRSTKLIHGGLRYLKQFEIALVREVGLERDIVFHNAPHLVIPEKMLLPIVKKGSLSPFTASIGLYVYDWLAGVVRAERRKMLSVDETLKTEPLLDKQKVIGGAMYTEYRSDDARLVIETIKKAVEHGAVCLNYVEAKKLLYSSEGKTTGAEATDLNSGQTFQLKAKKVINAAGPWVDEIRELDKSRKGKRLHLTKGIHIVVDHARLPIHHSMYFDVEDGRMIFAIPRGETTYIGTTDTNYQGNKENPSVTKADVEYVIAAANAVFPTAKLTAADVQSTWSGLRPLIHEDGKDPSELSRKDEIFISPSGLISIAGGKLTGYRQMARKSVDVVLKQLKEEESKSFVPCKTEKITLSGGGFTNRKEIFRYIESCTGEAKQIGGTPKEVADLVWKYGTNTTEIIEKAYELHEANRAAGTAQPENLLWQAEVWYAINKELALNLGDFLIRRTGMLYFERPKIAPRLNFYTQQFAIMLNWDAVEQKHQADYFDVEYKAVLNFTEEAE